MVRRDEIRLGRSRCLPSCYRSIVRSQVVVLVPSLVLFGRVTVQAIDADQVAHLVTIVDKRLQPSIVLCRPLAGLGFAALFNEGPVQADPAVIVVSLRDDQIVRIRQELVIGCKIFGQLASWVRIQLRRASEGTNLSADRNLIVEEKLLVDVVLLVFEQH